MRCLVNNLPYFCSESQSELLFFPYYTPSLVFAFDTRAYALTVLLDCWACFTHFEKMAKTNPHQSSTVRIKA